ncbi:olfactory receptor 52K2-like [Conger conger]|uniref:olfactory receptor 52K2-like n=1 Tax=Conger conger TaxID=82655 RepID=UPI002A5A4958|nr:olfactory receptor 52K2-like [Conger conger]
MENASVVTSFILMAYAELEDHRYVYFTGFLLLFILMVLTNIILIIVIYIETGLHEPMYFLLCNLAVNGIYGTISLLPSVLGNLMSHTYEISLTACLLQIFCIHTYAAVEFTTLAVMGYDRYAAICRPLHYHQLMSHRKVCILIALSWFYPCIVFGLYFILTAQRTFCDRIIEKAYCPNFAVVKLSCLETSFQSKMGLLVTFFLIVPYLLMILFSYAQILRVCLYASKESQTKAIQTCTPHLLTVINYAVGCFFEIISSRFNMSHVPPKARIFLSLYFLIFPPLFNPVIYGISIQAIRVQIFKLFTQQAALVRQEQGLQPLHAQQVATAEQQTMVFQLQDEILARLEMTRVFDHNVTGKEAAAETDIGSELDEEEARGFPSPKVRTPDEEEQEGNLEWDSVCDWNHPIDEGEGSDVTDCDTESLFQTSVSGGEDRMVGAIAFPLPSNVPRAYSEMAEVFSKQRASTLPPHRLYDCAIDLHPGTVPPRVRSIRCLCQKAGP